MSVTYWVAKYVADPIRNEPRNIGVFVKVAEDVCARFFGERDDGIFDGRRVRGHFLYPQVYTQWRDYWRATISQGSLEEAVSACTPNFYVVQGGEVTDTGLDDAAEVCDFVYSLLVSEGPNEAYGWNIEAVLEADLASDIASAFAEWRLLEDMPDHAVPHPVVKGAHIKGARVDHVPSFTQSNGRLYVMESIDLGSIRQKPIRERAGWMAFMFDDIQASTAACQNYSIVRPEKDTPSETISYARSVLESASKVVNWADENQRQQFLQERRDVAISLG